MDKKVIAYKKNISNVIETDVLVVGGGPAGICAAIASSRNGAKTLLIERTGMLGGMATSGLVGPFMTCYDRDGNEQIVKGIFDEIVRRTEKASGAIHPSKIPCGSRYTSYLSNYHKNVTPFDSAILQTVLDEMVIESGTSILLYTQFADSILANNSIDNVVIANREGIRAIRAKVYIDCTGDADVAAFSEVETWKGDEETGIPQPCTLFFEVDNVDDSKYLSYPPYKAYLTNTVGRYKINHTKMYNVDATNTESITNAHIDGRKQVVKTFELMKQNIPGFEDARLVQCADVIGVRESRHIKGRYILTANDVCDNPYFYDAIMTFGYGMDVHSRTGKTKNGFFGNSANWYTIPFRSLVPIGCNNLLVAGRAISAESQAAGSFRVMPGCMALGQAAGSAAALSLQLGVLVGDIPHEKLQKLLLSQDVVIKGMR